MRRVTAWREELRLHSYRCIREVAACLYIMGERRHYELWRWLNEQMVWMNRACQLKRYLLLRWVYHQGRLLMDGNWSLDAADRDERKLIYRYLVLVDKFAIDARLGPLVVYEVSETLSFALCAYFNYSVFNHLHLICVVVSVIVMMTVGWVEEMTWELVLIEEKAIWVLWPGHNGVFKCEWIKLQHFCGEELGFELRCEVV